MFTCSIDFYRCLVVIWPEIFFAVYESAVNFLNVLNNSSSNYLNNVSSSLTRNNLILCSENFSFFPDRIGHAHLSTSCDHKCSWLVGVFQLFRGLKGQPLKFPLFLPRGIIIKGCSLVQVCDQSKVWIRGGLLFLCIYLFKF